LNIVLLRSNVFSALRGGLFDLLNFRNREWHPGIEALGPAEAAGIYDLRSTLASQRARGGDLRL
jgi:hypothetical protein